MRTEVGHRPCFQSHSGIASGELAVHWCLVKELNQCVCRSCEVEDVSRCAHCSSNFLFKNCTTTPQHAASAHPAEHLGLPTTAGAVLQRL